MSSPEPELPTPASMEPYRELFERSADAILILEGELFADCNDAAVKMLGYATKQEVLQTHPSELSPPQQPDGRDSYEKANEMIEIAFRKGSHRFEWDHKRASGEVFPVEVVVTSVQEPGRKTLHVVWRDITERKQLEDELRQAQKMEALGRLTGGIAHDFNNLLVSILGYSELARDRLERGSEPHEFVSEVHKAGERAAELVRQLLAFGRKQQLLPVLLDLNELIRNIESLIQKLLGEGIELETKLTEQPLTVKADRSQIEQVLLNLASNARDAMPKGGVLRIETVRGWFTETKLDSEERGSSGECARLVFADTGKGMDNATANQAFDPFFTTKAAGAGSGLGLATVYGIVKQSRGGVVLRSVPGVGTEVEIQLPLTTERAVEESPRPRSEEHHSAGAEAILVVEDERTVARLVRRSLEARGYTVFSCADGREALEFYTEHHSEVALLLTDVIMPRMGGPELVLELRRLGHDPRVLFMSGYTDDALSPLHDAGFVNTLEKPFDVGELAKRVRRAIDA